MANRYAPIQVIDIDTNINNTQTATVTAPGFAFRLVNVIVDGADGAMVTVKNGANVAAVAYVAGVVNGQLDSTTALTDANCDFAAGTNISIAVTGANVTRVQLLTRAADAVARPITVTVA